ncbi:hypothetical protein AB4238_14490 [Shewanella sp. 10N.286.45.A1]|uniref:hypothetical protein n=1 Tax=Shewanella sp. 10N.286.45.A1 TaxID=3229694 RepID=UPI00354BB133
MPTESAVCTLLLLRSLSADSIVRAMPTYRSVCDLFYGSRRAVRTVPAKRAVCALLLLYTLSADGAVCHMFSEPSCLLCAVSAYALCNRFTVFDLPADAAVRDLCTESCCVLCSVSTGIKPAMCYL